MKFPARLAHLATKAVVIAKLTPTFAQAHTIDEEEAASRLSLALTPRLLDEVLASTWQAMLGKTQRLDEAALLEKVARALKDRPLRPGRLATVNPAWSAFLVVLDLEAGTASDAARKLIESEQGRAMAAKGMAEAGGFLGAELTR